MVEIPLGSRGIRDNEVSAVLPGLGSSDLEHVHFQLCCSFAQLP